PHPPASPSCPYTTLFRSEHLESMDYMREGIHLRGMAQKDPLVEYRNEGHVMFLELNRIIREEVVALLFHAQVEVGPTDGGQGGPDRKSTRLNSSHQIISY